jgi:ATP-binding cassette subfamily C (CFTR/MRP) protein 1
VSQLTHVSCSLVLITTIAQLAFIAAGSKYMGAAAPAVLLVVCFIQHIYLKTSQRLRILDLEARAPLLAHVAELLRGQVTIRAYHWQSMLREEFIEIFDRAQRPYYLLLCAQSWLRVVLNMTTAGIAIVLVTLATQLSASVATTTFALAMLSLIGFGDTMAGLVQSWTSVETSLGAIARLKGLVDMDDVEKPLSVPSSRPSGNWPEKGHIIVKGATASHQ